MPPRCQGEGKYLEGGKEAGGQLVDQRFCPRIVEGEVYLGVSSCRVGGRTMLV